MYASVHPSAMLLSWYLSRKHYAWLTYMIIMWKIFMIQLRYKVMCVEETVHWNGGCAIIHYSTACEIIVKRSFTKCVEFIMNTCMKWNLDVLVSIVRAREVVNKRIYKGTKLTQQWFCGMLFANVHFTWTMNHLVCHLLIARKHLWSLPCHMERFSWLRKKLLNVKGTKHVLYYVSKCCNDYVMLTSAWMALITMHCPFKYNYA